MQNRDIEFKDGKAILSRATYEEIVAFCRMHGETDLPAFPNPQPQIEYPKPSKEIKKLTDE